MTSTSAVERAWRFWLGVASYVVPTFLLGLLWHMTWFEQSYRALGLFRPDPIMLLSLGAMVIQGIVFSMAYPRLFSRGSFVANGLLYGTGLAALSWSYTTLAIAAKHPMASLSDYVLLETGFTLVQFLIAGPLIALAYRN